ncbi:NUDIX domain-containing protein [Dethiothermospora halolimnae]|uniref:NUDIX domain-containing protein n=1 Tax=Dethiothermospora halolimnae TaxID=3114390 RepID=UPI003CCBC7BA
MNKYIVNVEAAIYKGDKWLIIQRSAKEDHAPGLLSLVGGKVETKEAASEVLEENLIREIREEVDIEVSKKLTYVESKSFISDTNDKVVDIVFLCIYKSGVPRCVSEDEVSKILWMTCDEIQENNKAPIWLKESILKADKKRREI